MCSIIHPESISEPVYLYDDTTSACSRAHNNSPIPRNSRALRYPRDTTVSSVRLTLPVQIYPVSISAHHRHHTFVRVAHACEHLPAHTPRKQSRPTPERADGFGCWETHLRQTPSCKPNTRCRRGRRRRPRALPFICDSNTRTSIYKHTNLHMYCMHICIHTPHAYVAHTFV